MIIDVQNDFCPGGTLTVPEGHRVVPVINRILTFFDKVVATQDWHPEGHVAFASSHTGKIPFESIDLDYGRQELWPDHCVQGSPGAGFHPDLDQKGIDLIVRKGKRPEMDSYSAFFENDRKTPTGLGYYLEGLGLEHLFLAGLATDFCVFFSCLDALKLGFRVCLIEDACRGIDTPPGGVKDRIREMTDAGAQAVMSASVGQVGR